MATFPHPHPLTFSPSGILSERPAEDLFVLDTAGAEAVKTDYAKKHKPLKSEQIIAQRSAVPAVDSRKRKSPEGVATGSSKRSKNGTYVSHKDLQRLKHLAAGGSTAAKDITLSESAAYDPWSVAPAPVSVEPELNFLEKKKAKRQPETLSHPPISLAASGKPFPAVKKPQGGKSYNPDFQDWDALVAREGQKEVEAELKRQQAEQAETERMEKALAEAARPEPKSDDEYESAWESEWDGIQSEAEDSQVTKKRPERKTPTERKKAIKRKEQEAKAKLEKQTKQREEQQNRVRQITKAVEKKERERKLRLALAAESDASEDENQDEVLRRRKFGKNPYVHSPTPSIKLVRQLLTLLQYPRSTSRACPSRRTTRFPPCPPP